MNEITRNNGGGGGVAAREETRISSSSEKFVGEFLANKLEAMVSRGE